MKKQILFAGASLLAIAALSVSAQAADLPSRMQAPMLAAPPVFTWTGFYIGSTVGGVTLDSKYSDNTPVSARETSSAVTIGSTVGYNYQLANFVLGLEADYNWADIHRFGDAVEMDGFGTVRGRLGLARDRALFYVTGGFAFSNLKSSITHGAVTQTASFDTGWTIGTGVEYAIAPNVTVKLEGLYMDFGRKGEDFAGGFHASVKTTATVGRVGLNYKF